MGTEIKTKMKDHLLNEFWGGDRRGVCLQITTSSALRVRETPAQQLQEEGFVQLTVEEATTLYNDLEKFIKRRERK